MNNKIPFRTLLKYALVNPWHVIVFCGGLMFGACFNAIQWALVCFVFIELLMLAVTLVSKSFHRYVRTKEVRAERTKIINMRTALLESVSSGYKPVINNLMIKIDSIKDATSNTAIADECHRLLLVYIKLAQSLKVIDDIGMSNWGDFRDKYHGLCRKTNRTPIEQERFVRLEKHIALRQKNSADYECIRQQLDSIEELIDYTLEKSVSFPPNLTKIRVSVNESSMETTISEEVLKEMEEFAGIDEHTVLQ